MIICLPGGNVMRKDIQSWHPLRVIILLFRPPVFLVSNYFLLPATQLQGIITHLLQKLPRLSCALNPGCHLLGKSLMRYRKRYESTVTGKIVTMFAIFLLTSDYLYNHLIFFFTALAIDSCAS